MYLFAVRAGEQHWTVCEVMLLHFRIEIISLFTTKHTRPAKHTIILIQYQRQLEAIAHTASFPGPIPRFSKVGI